MGNISYIVLEEELFTFFLNCGEIENVGLSRDPIFFSARLPVYNEQEQRSYAKVYRLKGRLEFKRAQNAIQRAFDSEWKETKQKVKISLRLLLCDGQSLR